MCQSKAQGGVRCNHYTVKATSAAVSAWVRYASGMDRSTVDTSLKELRTEYADAPEPTRMEVDDFLAQQSFRVRHDTTLPEKRKGSILRRLRDAIGSARPDGATFQGWKNLLGKVWQKARKPVYVAATGLAITGLLAAAAAGVAGGVQRNADINEALGHNEAIAFSQKYPGATSDGVFSGNRLHDYQVNGKTESCYVSEDIADDLVTVKDITLKCVEDETGQVTFSPETSGRVDPGHAGQVAAPKDLFGN